MVKTALLSKFTGVMDEDDLGNDVPVLADPVEVSVFSWSIHSEADLDNSYTSRNIQTASLCLPTYDWSLMDQFDLDGGDLFEVFGIEDCTNGWHGWQPGITLKLRRVLG